MKQLFPRTLMRRIHIAIMTAERKVPTKRNRGKLVSACFFILFLFGTSNLILGVGGVPEYIANFSNFTDQIVHILETSEPTEHRPGVHLYLPFTLGYLLANIYEMAANTWAIPVKEVPEAIFTLKRYVATDYAALLRLFKKRQFRVSSTIFSRYHNVTRPSTFPQLLTQVITLDISKNRTEFRANIKEILERGTKGHLENEMLPKKDAAWKEIFDNATHGVYVNTLHYKSAWDRPWTEIGERNFFDGVSIPFIESPQGEYLYAEGDNATAVVVDIQASTKQVILIKPRDFTGVTDMRRIVRGMLNNESLWKRRNVTIQMPSLNVTNLSQPSDKFPFVGVTDTFCRGRFMDSSAFYFNQHPIAHANHFEFSTKYLEIASASGSLVAYQNNKDFLPKPPANKSQLEITSTRDVEYFEILEANEEEDDQFQDYIVDARTNINRQTRKFRGDFRRVTFRNNNDNEVEDMDVCDPNPGQERKEVMVGGMENDGKGESPTELPVPDETLPPTDIPMPSSPTSTSASANPEDENKMLVLDVPFSWILRDKEIGEVFYGSVSSLCQYKRAIQHIPTVPAWVLDLFKAFYWRCV